MEKHIQTKDGKTNSNNRVNKKPSKKSVMRKRRRRTVLVILLILFIALGIFIGVRIYNANGNLLAALMGHNKHTRENLEKLQILILGESTGMSDTIIVAQYDPKTQEAALLSIPRDTFVGDDIRHATSSDKINSKYSHGDTPQETIDAVNELTGLNIKHYILVDTEALIKLVDTIGGLDFEVPMNMNYDDASQNLHIHLTAGYQKLSGAQVEQLARFRHNNDGSSYPSSYGDNDYGRMRTQRDFIKAVIDQKVSLANIGALKGVAASVYTNLQTNMSGYKVLDYVPHALKFKTSDLRTEQLPGQSAMINNLWFYKTNFNKTRNLVNELMVYLELDNETLKSHYKYWKDIEGVKPDGNWVSNEVYYKDDYVAPSKKDENEIVDKEKCTHEYVVYDDYSDKATCTKTGTVVYKCTKCLHEYTKQTDALGHSFKNGVCTRDGCKEKDPKYKPTQNENKVDNSNTVDDNKQEEPKHEHKYTETITKQPTCTEAGTKTLECSCGDKKTEPIKANGHSFSSDKQTCANCSEPNPNYKAPEPEVPVNPDPEKPTPGENEDKKPDAGAETLVSQ